ncbi:MAG TPA: hypothetical protein VGK92_15150 [Gaiellales bacterium]
MSPRADSSLPLPGSSIATPLAAGWVTDFLNAAYFARPRTERTVSDLRLAHGILSTRANALGGRRLGARDLAAFHRAFGRRRFAGRGRLDSEALIQGAAALLGDWFPEAWWDDRRRAHGIAFESEGRREQFDPASRRHARPGRLTPPRAPLERQSILTYEPVVLPSAEAALAFLGDPARWPDMACDRGRFTALRRGGLEGQTFEIELEVGPAARMPAFIRAYVTCTAVLRAGSVLDGLVGALAGRAPELADAGSPVALVELTTHARHPLGAAISRLLIARSMPATRSGTWASGIRCRCTSSRPTSTAAIRPRSSSGGRSPSRRACSRSSRSSRLRQPARADPSGCRRCRRTRRPVRRARFAAR